MACVGIVWSNKSPSCTFPHHSRHIPQVNPYHSSIPLQRRTVNISNTLAKRLIIKMKASSIVAAISLALSGTTFAADGFLKSCSNLTLSNLNGVKGRSPLLGASCKVDDTENWSQLNLNACFGWSVDDCRFIFPPSGGFTDSVTGCNNTFYGGDQHFGENFGCYGPCGGYGSDEYYDVFILGKIEVESTLPILTPALRPLTGT